MKYYDNGELITKPDMQDEPWWNAYNHFIIAQCGLLTEDIEAIVNKFKEYYDEDELKDRGLTDERLIRWGVLQVERLGTQKAKLEMANMIKQPGQTFVILSNGKKFKC